MVTLVLPVIRRVVVDGEEGLDVVTVKELILVGIAISTRNGVRRSAELFDGLPDR